MDEHGEPIRRSPEQVADILHLPVLRCHWAAIGLPLDFLISLLCKQAPNPVAFAPRVKNAFKMAQRAISLVADSDPVEAIYEDEDVIAVNKPAGVISAPKHRFTVSSACYALLFTQISVLLHALDQSGIYFMQFCTVCRLTCHDLAARC